MKTTSTILTLAAVLCSTLSLPAKSIATPKEQPIDLVICLDTSNSMDGLIGAAKAKLWDIVNELGRATPRPHLRVGLYAYGTPAYGAESGYVRKVLDLTDDLDTVYAKLTELRTNGGEEYVARVVRAATLEQPWSDEKNALKIIVVAGNEAATQDPKFKTLEVCKDAIAKGIIVNTIYCNPPGSPEAAGWREAALAADGQFASIDQDKGVVMISTPFDAKLAELSGEVNQTYVAYGRQAGEKRELQLRMDAASAQASPSVAASRAVAKSSGQYRNTTWDLVDAREQKDFDLTKVKTEELPAEMQKMTVEEQKKYLDEKAAERAKIQTEINELNLKRQNYIRDEVKKTGKSTDKAFDAAMLAAIRKQAERQHFTFDSEAK
jgi:hypothetical protein